MRTEHVTLSILCYVVELCHFDRSSHFPPFSVLPHFLSDHDISTTVQFVLQGDCLTPVHIHLLWAFLVPFVCGFKNERQHRAVPEVWPNVQYSLCGCGHGVVTSRIGKHAGRGPAVHLLRSLRAPVSGHGNPPRGSRRMG